MSSESVKYQLNSLPSFARELKRLSKKYPSIKKDVQTLFDQLTLVPAQGVPLGRGAYKIRLAIGSKGKGKSGGARVITLVLHVEKQVFLLAIYDKSETQDIEAHELIELIEQAWYLAS
jgi:mRNA-degrading endonuclease RelE of RelBE toxin-antitoxin system